MVVQAFLKSWKSILLVLVVAIILSKVYDRIKYARLARKWGTKPVDWMPGHGISKTLNLVQTALAGGIIDFNHQQFVKTGKDTLLLKFIGVLVMMTYNPANIKALLSLQFNEFDLGTRPQALSPLLGRGIFVAEGHKWKHLRELLKPHFSREQISHVSMLESHVQNLSKHIDGYRGTKFDIQPLFHKLTMDASSEFLMGESVHSLKFGVEDEKTISDYERKVQFDKAITFVQEYLFWRVVFFKFGWIWNLLKFRQSLALIHGFMLDMINRILDATPSEIEQRTKGKYIFLYELLKETRDPVTLREETMNVIMAGRSTTASLLSGVFYELSRNSEVHEKLKNEIYEHFGRATTDEEVSEITFESLKRCAYLRHVLNEVLRMHPPVPQNLRRALKDTTLPKGGGPDGQLPVLIKKGHLVALNMYAMQRLPEFYGPDAHLFRPERWQNLSKIGWAFMPFGSGPRICLGQQFALTEASYFIVRLLQRYPNILGHNSPTTPPPKRSTATALFFEGVNVSLW